VKKLKLFELFIYFYFVCDCVHVIVNSYRKWVDEERFRGCGK